jgi:hypothetical protein
MASGFCSAAVGTPDWYSTGTSLVSRNTSHLYFICNIFQDAVGNSDYIESSDCLITHNELERIWNEMSLA